MKALSLCLVVIMLGCAASAIYSEHKIDRGFGIVEVGDTKAAVEARMGEPSVVKQQGEPFFRYADSLCEDPCTERLWYEARYLLDSEAWSVDIAQDGRVTDKYHWVSP